VSGPDASFPPPLSDRPELPAGVDRPARAERQPPDEGLRRLPVWAPVVVFVLGVVGSVIVAVVVAAIYQQATGRTVEAESPPDVVTILGTVAQNATWVGLAFLAVQMALGGRAGPRLGLRGLGVGSAFGWSALVYVTFWISAGVIALTLGEPEAEQRLVEELRAQDDVLILTGYAIVATIFAPLGEEILFRGLLYGALRERMPYWIAAVLTGVLFGFIHFDAPIQGILLLCVFGIGLCLLYQVTGSLLPCLGLHALHNSITFSYTKELPWWGFSGVIAASCAAVVAVGLAAGRVRSQRS
jgi:uncharacterized protein